MSGMEKIDQAILEKVKADADNIIKEAESKAREELERAKKQREARIEEEKNKIVSNAREEAARTLAQASIKARQELLAAKTAVIDEIISRVRAQLSGTVSYFSLINLIKETLTAFNFEKIRVYVSPRDIANLRTLVGKEQELANKVVEFKEINCLGGVIVEDLKAGIRVDNTFETRLDMLLPKLLPEISKELFGQ
jgi:vacuolar-type H+-ATPase subunit E/Vma4